MFSFHEIGTATIPHPGIVVDSPTFTDSDRAGGSNCLHLGASVIGVDLGLAHDIKQVKEKACQTIASGSAAGLEAEVVLSAVFAWCNHAKAETTEQASFRDLRDMIETLAHSIDTKSTLPC